MAHPEHEQKLYATVQDADRNADLSGCDLSKSRFTSLRLPGGNFTNANLSGADFSGAYLSEANLQQAVLKKARLVFADLRRANLTGADLTGADLNGVVLSGGSLAGANLTRALLVKTRLDGVDFTGANLDRTDLRGAIGITAEQIARATRSEKAVFDEKQLTSLQRTGDTQVARHGIPQKVRAKKYEVDLLFRDPKPTFGDLFVICGEEHPEFPPQGDFPFGKLANLKIEQTEDYFAVCVDHDPAIWIFPLIKGRVVEHHHGPYDGLRLSLDRPRLKKHWEPCLQRFREVLRDHLQ